MSWSFDSWFFVKLLNYTWLFFIVCEIWLNLEEKNQWQKICFGHSSPSLFDLVLEKASGLYNLEWSSNNLLSLPEMMKNNLSAIGIACLCLMSPFVSSAHVMRDFVFYFAQRPYTRRLSINDCLDYAATISFSGSPLVLLNNYFITFGILSSITLIMIYLLIVIFLIQYSLLLGYYICFSTLVLLSLFYSKSYLNGVYGYYEGLSNFKVCQLRTFMWCIDHTCIYRNNNRNIIIKNQLNDLKFENNRLKSILSEKNGNETQMRICDNTWIRCLAVCLLHIIFLKPKLILHEKKIEKKKKAKEKHLAKLIEKENDNELKTETTNAKDESDDDSDMEGETDNDNDNKKKSDIMYEWNDDSAIDSLKVSIDNCQDIFVKLFNIFDDNVDISTINSYWNKLCNINDKCTNLSIKIVTKNIVNGMNRKSHDLLLRPFVAYLMFYRWNGDSSNETGFDRKSYFSNPFNFCSFKDIFIANNPFLTINRDLHFYNEFEANGIYYGSNAASNINNSKSDTSSGYQYVNLCIFLFMIAATLYVLFFHVSKLIKQYIEKNYSWLGIWFSKLFLINMTEKKNVPIDDWDHVINVILKKIDIIIWNLWIIKYFNELEMESISLINNNNSDDDDDDDDDRNLILFLEGTRDLKNIILEYLVGDVTKKIIVHQARKNVDSKLSAKIVKQLIDEMIACDELMPNIC